MDKDTRNNIQRATQAGRILLERAFSEQLEGTFDILLDGTVETAALSAPDDTNLVMSAGTRTVSGAGASVNVNAASANTAGAGGSVNLTAGNHAGASGNGGNVVLTPGSSDAAGADGKVQLRNSSGTDRIVIDDVGIGVYSVTPVAQAFTIADPAANAHTPPGSAATGGDLMSAVACADLTETSAALAAIETAVQNNITAIDAILAAIEGIGVVASV